MMRREKEEERKNNKFFLKTYFFFDPLPLDLELLITNIFASVFLPGSLLQELLLLEEKYFFSKNILFSIHAP